MWNNVDSCTLPVIFGIVGQRSYRLLSHAYYTISKEKVETNVNQANKINVIIKFICGNVGKNKVTEKEKEC